MSRSHTMKNQGRHVRQLIGRLPGFDGGDRHGNGRSRHGFGRGVGARLAGGAAYVAGGATALGMFIGNRLRGPLSPGRRSTVRPQPLSADFVQDLAGRVEGRLHQGEDLSGALGDVLRAKLPLLLVPPARPGRIRAGRWLLGLSALALAGVVLRFAARLVPGGAARAPDGYGSFRAIHGTAGARMPEAPPISAADRAPASPVPRHVMPSQDEPPPPPPTPPASGTPDPTLGPRGEEPPLS